MLLSHSTPYRRERGHCQCEWGQTTHAPAAHACKVYVSCVHECLCPLCIHVDARRGCEVSSSITVCLIILRQGLLVNWNFVTKLAGQESPEICLSLFPTTTTTTRAKVSGHHAWAACVFLSSEASPQYSPLVSFLPFVSVSVSWLCVCSLTKVVRWGMCVLWKILFWTSY